MAYRFRDDPPSGHLMSTQRDSNGYVKETYIDEWKETNIEYRESSPDSDNETRLIELSRHIIDRTPLDTSAIFNTYNFRGVAELPAQEIVGQYQPIEFSQSGLTWTAEGPLNIEGSVIDMSAFDPIQAYDHVTVGYLNTKATNPEVEELKNEVQELKDRIDKLEMLLLEN